MESVPGEGCVRGDTVRVTRNRDNQVIERGLQLDVYELFILSGQQFWIISSTNRVEIHRLGA